MLKLPDRPVQLQALTDYAVSQWKGRSHIDVTRIGAFGFSLGGMTVLVDVVAGTGVFKGMSPKDLASGYGLLDVRRCRTAVAWGGEMGAGHRANPFLP